MKLSDRANLISSSPLYKIFAEVRKRESEGQKIVNLGVGLPWQDTPSYIKKAGIEAIEKGKTQYAPASGLGGLKKAIYKKLAQEGLTYDDDSIMVSSGAKPLLAGAQWALVNDNDGVVIPTPYYPPFVEVTKQFNGAPFLLDTSAEGFQLTANMLEKFLEEQKNKLKVIIINSPNNPTGAVYRKAELLKIAEVIKKYDLWVISDECYCDLTYDDNEAICFASLPGMSERAIVIRSFSKSYAMTGWRVGYAFGPYEVIKKISMYLDNFIGCAPSISQYAAVRALEEDNFTVELKNSLDENRKLFISWLKEKGIFYAEPQGAFYIFMRYADIFSLKGKNKEVTHPLAPFYGSAKAMSGKQEVEGARSVAFAECLLDAAAVAVTPGIAFGENYDDYVRVSYSVRKEELEEALKKLEGIS